MLKQDLTRNDSIRIEKCYPQNRVRIALNKRIKSLVTQQESQIITEKKDSSSFHDNSNSTFNLNTQTNFFAKKKKGPNAMGEITNYIFGDKTKLLKGSNFNDTKEYEFLYYQYKVNCGLQCIFSFMSMCSAIIEYEGYASDKGDISSILASVVCMISSFFLWATIIFEFFIDCKILNQTKKLPEKIWRKYSKNVLKLIASLVLFFIHPSPMTHWVITTTHNDKYNIDVEIPINAYFTMICLFRCWFFIKFYLVNSSYSQPRTQRICEMNGFDTNLNFALKSSMSRSPFNFYSILFIIIISICSYGIRIFERGLDKESDLVFNNFWNCVWCLVITMTTVGYGDYIPSSAMGRIFVIFSCFCGVFLLSMLIVAITNILNIRGNEKNIYLILERVDLMEEKDILAARLVSRYVKLLKLVKKNKQHAHHHKKQRDELLFSLFRFKEKCKEIDSTFPSYSNFDNIVDNLHFLERNVDSIQEKYATLNNIVKKISNKLNAN